LAEQVIRLIFPPAQLNTPVINTLIRTYQDITVNILRAEVTEDYGWLEVHIVGTSAMIESAVSWLRNQGIETQTLGA